jgi:hypothetical protein
MPKYTIDCLDLEIEWRDLGRWRSYSLSAHGDTLDELVESATISEVDQDGGELRCYGLGEADNEVFRVACKTIEAHVEKKRQLQLLLDRETLPKETEARLKNVIERIGRK